MTRYLTQISPKPRGIIGVNCVVSVPLWAQYRKYKGNPLVEDALLHSGQPRDIGAVVKV